MFTNSTDIYDSARKFTRLSEKYLNEYAMSKEPIKAEKETHGMGEIVTIILPKTVSVTSMAIKESDDLPSESPEMCGFDELNKLHLHTMTKSHIPNRDKNPDEVSTIIRLKK